MEKKIVSSSNIKNGRLGFKMSDSKDADVPVLNVRLKQLLMKRKRFRRAEKPSTRCRVTSFPSDHNAKKCVFGFDDETND